MSVMQFERLGTYLPLGTYRYLGKPTPGRPQLLFGILIDWDADGAHDGVNEARWMIPGGLEVERGREFYVRSDGTGFERVDKGRCTITLDNTHGRYDPRNTDSPLYPHLLNKKEREATVFVQNGDSGNRYPLITGRMVDFIPINDRRGRKTLRIQIEDGFRYLHHNKANVDIQENIDTHAAIGMVLDDIQWPWGRDLQTGVDTIPWWWVFNRSSNAEIQDIAESELGIFFIGANGDARFLNRFYMDDDPLLLNGFEISPEILDRQPSETVKDRVILRIHPRVLRAQATLWTLQDVPLSIPNGQTKTLWPEFTYENRSVPVIDPVIEAGTDYNFFENSNGSGANLTGGLSVSYENFGEGGKIIVRNTSGTDGWLIDMKMRGQALDSPDAVRVQAGDGESVMELDLTLQQKVASGQDNADFIHTFLSDPDKYYLTISLEGNPEKQFSRDLFRWVDLTIRSKGISDMFRISKLRHRLLSRRVVQTTMWLEPTLSFASSNETQLPFQLPARYGVP